MSKDITPNQRYTIEFIMEFILENHRPPTIQEIADRFDIARNAANSRVRGLFKKGLIDIKNGKIKIKGYQLKWQLKK